nr:HNH endonuclease signature motif containing protein [Gordonia sp. SID5947]
MPARFVGGIDPTYPVEEPLNDLLMGLVEVDHGRSYLAYCEYASVAVMFDRLVAAREDSDGFVVDGFADCASRISKLRNISRHGAEVLLNESIALRDRLPEVFDCLGDGLIAPWQAKLIVSRTDLLDDRSVTPLIDASIADLLRRRRGTWSKRRLRDMVDRIIFRHDPNSVRERRKEALDARGVWTESRGDGVAEITAVMAAENVRIAAAAVAALADAACAHDGRTKPQRMSDAMFALLSGTAFECQCGRDDCQAQIPESGTLPPVDATIVLHVVCDESTLAGTAANPGFMDGHGVISDEHVRDIATRGDTAISFLVAPGTAPDAEDSFTLPAHQPSDPYRPSTALATHTRLRDGYCVEPGCDTSAFAADLDHVSEYDHTDPTAGGKTTSINLNAKCRSGHLLKTFGDWLDDQYRDDDSRLVTEFITPEGLVIAGEAETNEDLFPGLRRIRFHTPPATAPPPPSPPGDRPVRAGTRTADKHARRRAERSRNRRRNNAGPAPDY